MAKKALHSQSYGGRGCKVRVYEPREGANFMIAPFVGGKYHPRTLGHRDAKKAEAAAYALITQLQNGKRQTTEPSKLTLKALVDLYLTSESYKTLKPQQRAEKMANLERIVAYFGPAKLVTALDEDAVTGLLTARREGTNGFGKAGQQTVYKCYSDLKSVILWGLKKKNAAGARILLENPIAGMDVRPNKTPAQPIISHETFTMLRRAARKKLLPYIRVFLIVAEGTGRRAGAVRNLEWRDVDLEAGSILWRGETDKMGHEMHRPMSRRVVLYLRAWKQHCPSSRWVFPAPSDASQVVPKITVDKWPGYLYKAAGLKRPAQVGWHSLRRKWASERDGYAIPVLMQAGGWASSAALMRYLHTDARQVAAVIQQPTRRV